MKTNMGTADRAIRVLVALAIGGAYFAGMISGTVGIVLAVVAVVFLGTSAVGMCPAYLPLGLSTKKDG
jgi:K+-transporting ATPase A subunit